MDKKYNAKKDFLVVILILLAVAAIAVVAIFCPRDELWGYIFALVLLSAVLVLFLISLCRTYYVFKEDYLLVVSGVFRKKIYYRTIERVEPNISIWSSFCLSVDRIKIWTGKGFWQREYIAPVDKQDVITELKMRASEARKILEYRK